MTDTETRLELKFKTDRDSMKVVRMTIVSLDVGRGHQQFSSVQVGSPTGNFAFLRPTNVSKYSKTIGIHITL